MRDVCFAPRLANQSKRPPLGALEFVGGERGIRTLEGVLALTPLAGERFRPLSHLSEFRDLTSRQPRKARHSTVSNGLGKAEFSLIVTYRHPQDQPRFRRPSHSEFARRSLPGERLCLWVH